MGSFFRSRFVFCLSLFLFPSASLFSMSPEKHVHLVHLNGLESNAFRALLDIGQLPHIQFLLNRGLVSHEATTVDKSETMKVLMSYLTSQTDTEVVGWSQFNRNEFRFRNFWQNPVDVIHYALGLELPSDPTIFDFLSYKGLGVTSGFGLHRRSVPIDHYVQAHIPSFKAVTAGQSSYKQAHATMETTLALYKKAVEENNIPTFSTSLLTPADEYVQSVGITVPADSFEPIFCAKKEDHLYKPFFTAFEKDFTGEKRLARLITTSGYFAKTEPSASMKQVCVVLPTITVAGKDRQLRPEYVFGLMQIDLEIGNLIETLRSIQPRHHKWTYEALGQKSGIDRYEPENSLFDRTLLLLTGDHGIVDTPKKMGVEKDYHPESRKLGFLEGLNCQLRLATTTPGTPEKQAAYEYEKNGNCQATSNEQVSTHPVAIQNAKLGIDKDNLPLALSSPYQFIPKSHPLFPLKKEAEDWAHELIHFLADGLKKWYYDEHKVTSFFSSFTIDIVKILLEKKIKPMEPTLVHLFAHTYLKGIPAYVEWETHFLQHYYEKHIQLVYGGGSLNNAEIFVPIQKLDGTFDWSRRPSLQELQAYTIHGFPLLTVLRGDPAVGLTFIRENQREDIEKGPMRIHVWNENNQEGLILVKKDPVTHQLFFAYECAQIGRQDPLGYGDEYKNQWLTYHQWNDISIQQKKSPYHNVVAGIGSYLYSKNPSIGDILLVAKRDWSFSSNMAGHGGILREEKQTSMIVSHGNLTPGVLRTERGHHPTVLDLTPTILDWLGYSAGDMEAFAKTGAFDAHMRQWIQIQEDSLLSTAPDFLQLLAKEAHYGILMKETEFQKRLKRFLQFMPKSFVPTKDLSRHRLEGERLSLPQKKAQLF